MQLTLPMGDIAEAEEHSSGEMPKEIESALPWGFQWLPGNTLVPGQPFVLWGAPSRPDDFHEVQLTIDSIFETSRGILTLWPWYYSTYHFNPDTGVVAVVGLPFRSPQEMVVASVAPVVMNAIGRLAVTSTWLAAWSATLPAPSATLPAAPAGQAEKNPPARVTKP